MFRVYPECAQSVFRVCFISSPSASNVSVCVRLQPRIPQTMASIHQIVCSNWKFRCDKNLCFMLLLLNTSYKVAWREACHCHWVKIQFQSIMRIWESTHLNCVKKIVNKLTVSQIKRRKLWGWTPFKEVSTFGRWSWCNFSIWRKLSCVSLELECPTFIIWRSAWSVRSLLLFEWLKLFSPFQT